MTPAAWAVVALAIVWLVLFVGLTLRGRFD